MQARPAKELLLIRTKTICFINIISNYYMYAFIGALIHTYYNNKYFKDMYSL